jgi:DNA-binding response OmpR family regulator
MRGCGAAFVSEQNRQKERCAAEQMHGPIQKNLSVRSSAMNSLGPGPVAAVYPLPDSEPTLVLHPAILLVDGDEHALELEARALGAMGYERVTRVKGARDALLLLERDRLSADIIVCDLHMPDMDGIEFLQALNASAYRGSVILLSGEPPRLMHSVQRLLGGKRLTILGAITRPARRTELRALLGSWRPQAKPTPDIAAPCALTENDLRLAIAREEWVLHYQPQVSLESGILVGMEALVRWNHPVHGLIYPDRFIELAEACGAIDELSDWVVRTALQQRRLWVSVGAPLCNAGARIGHRPSARHHRGDRKPHHGVFPRGAGKSHPSADDGLQPVDR